MQPIVCFVLKQQNVNLLSFHAAQEKMVYLLCKGWHEEYIVVASHKL